MHQSKLSSMMTSVFNECYMVNITTGIDFSITFQSRVEEPEKSNEMPAVKYLMWEARSKGFNSRSLSVAEDQKKPYLWKGLKPDYCQSWTIFGELDSTSDVITAMNSLQNEKSPMPVSGSSLSQQDVLDTNCSGFGSPVLSGTSVKLEPDEAEQADKLDSNMNSVFTNFTAGVKLDEEPQPDEAEDEDSFSCTSNVVISKSDSLSTVKIENILVENDGIYRCDHCQKEFSEFDKLRSHIIDHLTGNLEPRETPGFNMLIGTNDEHFHGGGMMQGKNLPPENKSAVSSHSFVLHSCPVSNIDGFPELNGPCSSRDSRDEEISMNLRRGRTLPYEVENPSSLTPNDSDSVSIHFSAATKSEKISPRTNSGPFVCDHCLKKFSDFSELRFHVVSHFYETRKLGANKSRKRVVRTDGKGIATSNYPCITCGKVFRLVAYLKRHCATHTGEKHYKCELCDSRCSSPGNRDKHTHSENPFKCTICDERFICQKNRNKHMVFHTPEGSKPHKCAFCNKGFVSVWKLDIHVRTHTGEKPFKCDLCDTRFSQSYNLVRHVESHNREKPFKCDFCD